MTLPTTSEQIEKISTFIIFEMHQLKPKNLRKVKIYNYQQKIGTCKMFKATYKPF